MTAPFDLLELAADADPLAIRRAYARKLRQNRPDEDPEGFQRLHEAYLACLAWAQERLGAGDGHPPSDEPTAAATETGAAPADTADAGHATAPGDGSVRPPAIGQPQPAAAPAACAGDPPPADFSLTAFVSELHASDLWRDDGIESWLWQHPDLYPMANRHELLTPLLARLRERPALSPAGLESILRFFELGQLGPLQRRLAPAIAAARANSHRHGVADAITRWTQHWPWLRGLADDLLRIDASEPARLSVRLQAQSELHDPELRTAVTRPLCQMLAASPDVLSAQGLTNLLAFFGLPRPAAPPAVTGLLEQLQSRTEMAEALRLGNLHAYTDRSRPFHPAGLGRINRWILRDLCGEGTAASRMAIVLVTPWLARARKLKSLIEACPPGEIRICRWWRRASMPIGIHWERLVLIWGQALAFAIILGLPLFLIVVSATHRADPALRIWLWLVLGVATLRSMAWLALQLAIRVAQRHPDFPIVTGLSLIALMAALTCATFQAWIAAVLLVFFTTSATVGQTKGEPRWPAVLALFAGELGILLSFTADLFRQAWNGLILTAAACIPVVLVMVHDLALARRRGITVDQARTQPGWLLKIGFGWVLVIVLVALRRPP